MPFCGHLWSKNFVDRSFSFISRSAFIHPTIQTTSSKPVTQLPHHHLVTQTPNQPVTQQPYGHPVTQSPMPPVTQPLSSTVTLSYHHTTTIHSPSQLVNKSPRQQNTIQPSSLPVTQSLSHPSNSHSPNHNTVTQSPMTVLPAAPGCCLQDSRPGCSAQITTLSLPT